MVPKPRRRLILIGIDGIEPSLVKSLVAEKRSKGFKTLVEETQPVILKSSLPPDTEIAWPSIYTGVNPNRLKIGSDEPSVRKELKDKTFWDYAGRYGYKVCVINPFSAYPPWPVNGIMISRSARGGKMSAYPKWVEGAYRLSQIGATEGYGTIAGEYVKTYEKACKHALELARLALKALLDFDSDLLFLYFSELDYVQHSFWRFEDPNDPAKPLINLYKGYIRRFYELFDRVVKTFVDKYGGEYAIAVFGDHGHGPRPWKLFSLNELLRRRGLLEQKEKDRINAVMNFVKVLALEFTYYSRTEWLAYKVYTRLGKKNPEFRLVNLAKPRNSKSLITTSEFGKQFGGLYINETSSVKQEQLLTTITNLLNGLEIVEWVVRTRNIYSRRNVNSTPDVLFKLKDEYGVYHGLYAPIIWKNFERRIISGGHMLRTLLMLWPGPYRILMDRDGCHTITDMAPSVLQHFGIDPVPQFDGKPIWSIKTA